MSKSRKKRILIEIISVMILVALDQLSKYLVVRFLKDAPAIVLWPNVLELSYLENRGAAFGMLQNQKAFFICMEVLILFLVGYILAKCPEQKKYRLGQICLIGIIAGDIGNMIDRISQNYVVDFISFVLIHFPIFNVADIYVTVSMFLLLFLMFFYYKEEDLNFLSFKEKKLRELDHKSK